MKRKLGCLIMAFALAGCEEESPIVKANPGVDPAMAKIFQTFLEDRSKSLIVGYKNNYNFKGATFLAEGDHVISLHRFAAADGKGFEDLGVMTSGNKNLEIIIPNHYQQQVGAYFAEARDREVLIEGTLKNPYTSCKVQNKPKIAFCENPEGMPFSIEQNKNNHYILTIGEDQDILFRTYLLGFHALHAKELMKYWKSPETPAQDPFIHRKPVDDSGILRPADYRMSPAVVNFHPI